jgi:hypothetical protein
MIHDDDKQLDAILRRVQELLIINDRLDRIDKAVLSALGPAEGLAVITTTNAIFENVLAVRAAGVTIHGVRGLKDQQYLRLRFRALARTGTVTVREYQDDRTKQAIFSVEYIK